MKSIVYSAVIALAIWLGLAAQAQVPQSPPLSTSSLAIVASGTNTLSVTTSSLRVALSITTVPTVFITNAGVAPVCAKLGSGSVVATWAAPCPPGEFFIGAGQTVPAGIAAQADLAAITGSGSTTLFLIEGYFAPSTAQSTPVLPDVFTVTTGGTAVNAFSAGHCAKGCYIVNPTNATQPLCGNGITTASGTTTNGATICAAIGQQLNFSPRSTAISVVSSDSSHVFGGEGYQ